MTNPVSGGFQFTPATGLNDTVTYPTTPVSEAAARQQMMDFYWQIMNEMNLPTLSAAAYHSMARQAVINGNFDVWQRGTSFSNPATNSFISDRNLLTLSLDGGASPNIVHSRQNITPGELLQSAFFYRINVDGAGTSLGTNSFYTISQKIENGTRYLCGLGKKVTISLYARSSIAGKRLGVFALQNYGTGGSPTAQEILVGQVVTLTGTFTKYTFTLNTNTLTGKTFGSNNDDVLRVGIQPMWGVGQSTSYSNTSTAETFGGAGNIDITQVQVNAGDQALPFQPKSIAEELSLCRRYFQQRSTNTVSQYDLSPPMRINPTITGSGSPYNYEAEL